MSADRGVDELSSDPHPTTRLAHAAFEHVTDTQLTSNLLDVYGLAFVSEGRVTGDNEKRLEPRQRRGDVLHHPVGEMILLRVTAQVLERQDCNGGLVGQRRRVTVSEGRNTFRGWRDS